MAAGLGKVLPFVALGFLFLAGKSKAGGSSVITSTGPKKTKTSTSDGDAKTWARKRYELAHNYFAKYWANAMDEEAARQAALSVLAHWSLETGSGAGEYNFNVGNVHAVGNEPWYSSGDTSTKGNKYTASFAAFDTLEDGVRAYFDLLEKRYESCLQELVAHPTEADWFKCLGKSGYYAATMKGKDNIEPAAASWAARRALLAQYASS